MSSDNSNRSFDGVVQGFTSCPFTFECYSEERLCPSDHSDETTSLIDGVWDYPNENGRTYHAYRPGSYHFPNDPQEVERLNIQHDILKIVLNERNYFAPFSKTNPPRKVLDVATGTGRWAMEMGDEFPQADIIGTDLSPIQPELVNPNVRFYVDDATDEWQQGPDWWDLDYVHTRMTAGCWSDMPSQLIKPALERLRPGGWLESQELGCSIECDDGTSRPGPLSYMTSELVAASVDAGRPVNIGEKLKKWYEEAGFVDVNELVFKIPMNGWPPKGLWKQVGELWFQNLAGGLPALSYALLSRHRGMSKEEIEMALIDVRKNMSDKKQHIYQKFYVVIGRKPERGEL